MSNFLEYVGGRATYWSSVLFTMFDSGFLDFFLADYGNVRLTKRFARLILFFFEVQVFFRVNLRLDGFVTGFVLVPLWVAGVVFGIRTNGRGFNVVSGAVMGILMMIRAFVAMFSTVEDN